MYIIAVTNSIHCKFFKSAISQSGKWDGVKVGCLRKTWTLKFAEVVRQKQERLGEDTYVDGFLSARDPYLCRYSDFLHNPCSHEPWPVKQLEKSYPILAKTKNSGYLTISEELIPFRFLWSGDIFICLTKLLSKSEPDSALLIFLPQPDDCPFCLAINVPHCRDLRIFLRCVILVDAD